MVDISAVKFDIHDIHFGSFSLINSIVNSPHNWLYGFMILTVLSLTALFFCSKHDRKGIYIFLEIVIYAFLVISFTGAGYCLCVINMTTAGNDSANYAEYNHQVVSTDLEIFLSGQLAGKNNEIIRLSHDIHALQNKNALLAELSLDRSILIEADNANGKTILTREVYMCLANMYDPHNSDKYYARTITKSKVVAEKYYLAAHNLGHPQAALKLGVFYYNEKNNSLAEKWLREAKHSPDENVRKAAEESLNVLANMK